MSVGKTLSRLRPFCHSCEGRSGSKQCEQREPYSNIVHVSGIVNFIDPIRFAALRSPAYAGMTKKKAGVTKNVVMPAQAGIHCPAGTKERLSATHWIPAFAGMTVRVWWAGEENENFVIPPTGDREKAQRKNPKKLGNQKNTCIHITKKGIISV